MTFALTLLSSSIPEVASLPTVRAIGSGAYSHHGGVDLWPCRRPWNSSLNNIWQNGDKWIR